MTTCPKCGANLKDEYGMSQCPACGTFSFIDMDGQAVVSEPDADVDVDAGAAPSHLEPSGAAAPAGFSDPIEGLLGVQSRDYSPDENENETATPIAPIATPDFAVFDPLPTDGVQDSESSFDNFASIDMTPEAPAADFAATPSPTEQPFPRTQTRTPQAFGPANDPLNLNDFANSEVSSAKDGPLVFRVLISGIDTKEIRESIREVLEDRRFAWDSNEIFSKVSKGHLVINGLSPVKASILITRIKWLPVSIRWEQYAITQGPNA